MSNIIQALINKKKKKEKNPTPVLQGEKLGLGVGLRPPSLLITSQLLFSAWSLSHANLQFPYKMNFGGEKCTPSMLWNIL
jgi:hypothetical protein